MIRKWLKSPLLIWFDNPESRLGYMYIVFEGEVKKNYILYKKCYLTTCDIKKSIDFRNYFNSIKKGNRIMILNSKINIYHNDFFICSIPRRSFFDGYLINPH